jgi:hypothetical protein
MDRGIGMDAIITAGPQDIGDGAITVDTGITATTTVDTGIAANSLTQPSIAQLAAATEGLIGALA